MNLKIALYAAVITVFFSFQVQAFDMPRKEAELPPKLKQAIEKIDFQRYYVRPQPIQYAQGSAAESKLDGWADFEKQYDKQWRLSVDSRTKAPLLVEGKGIPLIPGKGNKLDAAAFGPQTVKALKKYKVRDVAQVALAFLDQHQSLIKAQKENLILDEKASAGYGKNNRYWTLRYQSVYRDPALGAIPVRDAYVFFRINHGNLIQFGNQLAISPVGISTAAIISRQQAVDKSLDLLGNPPKPKVLEAVRDVGQADKTLQIVPLNLPDGSLGHQLVRTIWIVTDTLSFELWFDAHSGELVNAINKTHSADAVVRGGIYPNTNTDTEVLRGLPRLNVVNGTAKKTDQSGVYDYNPPGSLATATLEGDYVRVNDSCGTTSLSTSLPPGDLSFGRSAGTDCTTPGFGGNGNTHAGRSSFYHLNLIKDKTKYYLGVGPSDTHWLNNQLESRTNISGDCNAYWDGTRLKFYQLYDLTATYGVQCPTDATVDYVCSNTGEISAIFLHEFGHGLDDNTNGAPPENGSGEAYGDIMAFLQTHDACIGNNFVPNCPCEYGCGAGCTGVRDVDVAPNVAPANIDVAPADCDRWTCPYLWGIWPYQGPMGYEGHCESLIASGAVWDMIQGFVARYGDAGWALGDRIWYESLNQTGSAYQLVSGGQCNSAATVDGCGADNWYTVFLSIDDDNGNLADGTPNAGIIWNAFHDHGIACGTAAPAESTTCPAIAVPTLTATAATGQVQLSWTATANAASYRVFKNEFGCNQGFTPIADITAPATTYTDTTVNNGMTYYYAVQAVGTDDACTSAFSSCMSAAPPAPLLAANIMMVLDQSGSMSMATDVAGERKIDALKDAGSMVLDVVDDYAGDGFRIGAVSFSTSVTGSTGGVKDPSDMSSGGGREVLNNFINALSPTNLTAIGQGINAGVGGFPSPDDGKRKVVMLLSDGMQNVPPMLVLNSPPPGVAVGGTSLPGDIGFYTIALGTQIQEDLFDNLANQGGIPGFYYSGGTAEIQSNFAYWVADVLGLNPSGSPFAPVTGSGFAAQPATSSSSSGSSSAETFIVNRTARRVTFLVTWQAKGRDLRFYLDTPVGRIDPPSSSFHSAQGYAAYTVRFPFKGRGSEDHVGQWVLRVYEPTHLTSAVAQSSLPPLNAYALFDDPAIKLEYKAGGADPGAGEVLPFEVRVLENGNPISGLNVRVTVEGPETGLGELLSRTKIDDPKRLSAVQPGAGDRFPDEATRKLALMLEKDPNLMRMLPGNVIPLTEKRRGVYQGNLPAGRTVASTYVFTFEVQGKGAVNDNFQRSERFSRYVRLKPTVDQTVIKADVIDKADLQTIRFLVTPRDRAKNRLGPGWGKFIKATTSAGSFDGDPVDNLDGSYTLKLKAPKDSDPKIRIEVLGEPVADTKRGYRVKSCFLNCIN